MPRIAGIAARQRRRILMSYTRLAVPIALALAIATAAGAAAAQSPTAQSQPAPKEQMPPAAPPMAGPPSPSPLQPGDAFGEEVTLPKRTIVYLKGTANWDSAFETLVDAFKSLNEYFDKQGIKPNGLAMTIYTETSDTGFRFEAALPIAEAPKNPPKGDIAVGEAPFGRSIKFVHRGSYDSMDATYEAITNFLDEKQLEAKDPFIEEYVTDPLKTTADNLVVNVFVPVK
jgi:effector-binding domain-containing protein